VFNLRQDIGETNDLSDSMPEKVRELDEKLQAWLSSVRAKLPKPNPAWEGDDADRPQGE
jgi:arylsulfatase A